MFLILFLGSAPSEEISLDAKGATLSPEVRAILARSKQASGGEEVFAKVKSMKMELKVEMVAMGVSMQMKLMLEGEKIYLKTLVQNEVMQEQGYDGQVAWSKDMMAGLRELGLEESNSLISGSLAAGLYPEKFYDSIELGDEKTWENIEVDHLVFTRKGSKPRHQFYSKATGLTVGMRSVEKTLQGDIHATTRILEHQRTKSGFLYESKFEVTAGPMKMLMSVVGLEENPVIEPSVFAMPKE